MDALPETYWRYIARHELFLEIWKRHRVPQPRYHVLDIGCGAGGLLGYLAARAAITAVGFDVAPEALVYARRRGLHALGIADAARLPIRDESADLVIAQDVVEHVADDGRLLEDLARVCRPGGLALIVAPAYRALWSSRDVRLGHYRRYRLGELAARVKAAGLDVVHRTYLDFSLAPILRIAVALAPRSADGVPDLPQDAPGGMGLTNRLLLAVSRAEATVARRVALPLGASALVLGARPAR